MHETLRCDHWKRVSLRHYLFVRACVCMCVCLCACIRLLQLQRAVLSPDSDMPDELLYGRAGYLYALLYVNQQMGADAVEQDVITKVGA